MPKYANNKRRPHRVDLFLSDTQNEILSEISSETGVPRTEIIRFLIEMYGDQFLVRFITDKSGFFNQYKKVVAA